MSSTNLHPHDNRPECSVTSCKNKSVVYEQDERSKAYTYWCASCYLPIMERRRS